MNNSTLFINDSLNGNGGGIANGGTMTVSNSTLSGNSAFTGGGIYNSGSLTLVFTTLTLNQGVSGGVFTTNSGFTRVRNTISAQNPSTLVDFIDVAGSFTSDGYNLIGDGIGSTGFGVTGDIVGTSDNPIDPRFNDGPTLTIALLPDSPAIDAGDPTVLDTDPTCGTSRLSFGHGYPSYYSRE